MAEIHPQDRAEQTAVFRSQVIGPLVRRDLARGELSAELDALSQELFRPPGALRTRTYSVPTLERWLAAWRRGGLEALRPRPRRDRGRGRALSPAQVALLLDIRREYPNASVRLIIRTLEDDGRLERGLLSPRTLRRIYQACGLSRVARPAKDHTRVRLRWQAEQPGALWHGDVCHGPALVAGGRSVPLRIHALLDDASRRVVAIEARSTELEADMLSLFVGALRRHGRPDVLYLDNGATYSGAALATVCARLGVGLVHAKPYDPQARGKMERFWRTLRQGCLDFIGAESTLHDVNVRLWAFVDQHYHRDPHAGLMGRCPEAVWARRDRADVILDEPALRDAFTVRARRRVRRDSTLSFEGTVYEADSGFLAGQVVTVAWCPLDTPRVPWVEHEGRRRPLGPVCPASNGRRKRPEIPEKAPPSTHVPFDPPGAALDRALRRPKRKEKNS